MVFRNCVYNGKYLIDSQTWSRSWINPPKVGSGVNQFFSMRYPSVTITSLVAQLLSFPLGCFLAHALPVRTFRILGLWNFTINPDKHFNIKEHAVITIMSNLSFGASWVFSPKHTGGIMANPIPGYRYYPSSKGILQIRDFSRISNLTRPVNAIIWSQSCRPRIQVYCRAPANGESDHIGQKILAKQT